MCFDMISLGVRMLRICIISPAYLILSTCIYYYQGPLIPPYLISKQSNKLHSDCNMYCVKKSPALYHPHICNFEIWIIGFPLRRNDMFTK